MLDADTLNCKGPFVNHFSILGYLVSWPNGNMGFFVGRPNARVGKNKRKFKRFCLELFVNLVINK